MVLPSLKSIKTLFGSPHRRTSHSSRKHKEKKLPRSSELVGNCDPVPELHNCVTSSEPRQVELKDYRSLEQEIGVSVSTSTTDAAFTRQSGTPNSRVLTLEDVNGAVCPIVEVVGCAQSNVVKESPAKARVAPFNTVNDENWSSSSNQTVVDYSTEEEKDGRIQIEANVNENQCDELSIIKELLGRKVNDRQLLVGEEHKTIISAHETLQECAESLLDSCLNGDDGLTEALNRERVLRFQAEQRLHDVSCENERSKESLSKLQCDFLRLEEMLCSLLQYKTKIDWLKREKATQSLTYEVKLRKYQNFVANLQKENMLLLSEVKTLEASSKQSDDRERNLSRVLLERLRYLETENSSLVLETEQQRLQYERCLDDVANQVVQALLTQKSLREECIKLQKRVSDLEQRNRTLNLLFQQHLHLPLDSGFHRRFAGKLSSCSGTQPGSNRSSIATQTMSQSEDSLESLASLCSEYSTQSSVSGECSGGNMVIGIPGLPQLSSPPLWIRNCLEQAPWNNSYLGSGSASATALPSYFGSGPARAGAEAETDRKRPPSLLDDYVWPGMQSWDLDELVDGDDNACNYVVDGKSSTIQKRPFVVGVLSNSLASPSSVPLVLQMSPILGACALEPTRETNLFPCDGGDGKTSSNKDNNSVITTNMASTVGRGRSTKILWSPPKISVASVKRHRQTAISKTRQLRKSHTRPPRSLSLVSRKVRSSLDGKCRASLPRQFQYRLDSDVVDPPVLPAGLLIDQSAGKENGFGTQNDKSSVEIEGKTTGEEEKKKDEGYSTMSSDVQSQQEQVSLGGKTKSEVVRLQEEEDESERGFWMDMNQLSILVNDRETKVEEAEVIEEPGEEKTDDTEHLENCSESSQEITQHNVDESVTSLSSYLFGNPVERTLIEAEGFHIPFDCSENEPQSSDEPSISTGRMSRSTSAPEIYRCISEELAWRPRSASSACASSRFDCYLWWCASEGSLAVDGSTDVNSVTILRRSKRKVCLTDDQSGASSSIEEMGVENHKSQKMDEACTITPGDQWGDDESSFPISPLMDEADADVDEDYGKMKIEQDGGKFPEKADSTDSCEISSSSICSSSTVVRFSTLEHPVLESFEEYEQDIDIGREDDDCEAAVAGGGIVENESCGDGNEICKDFPTPVVDFCGEFYRLCSVDAESCGMEWAGIVNEANALAAAIKDVEDAEEDEERDEELAGSDDSSAEERDDEKSGNEGQLLPLQDSASVREKLEELSAMMAQSGGAGDDFNYEEIPRNRSERSGKEGCTTSWIHVEADIDLTDPRARANLLDTMLGSSASSSSSNSECGDEPSDYQHLHQLHRHRRQCKATERENCILRYIHPPRPSILGRRDFFFRYGEQEKAAVASFDFLEDMSTSVSDFGSAETLHAEEREDKETGAMKNSSCYGSSVTLQSQGVVNACSVDRLSLSDSCAESFSSSNQSLNMLDN